MSDETTRQRCGWAGTDRLYCAYHDEEWGRPVADDRRLYEKLCLEGFQSGLSWITVLRKRERFREVFHGFEIDRVAEMGEKDIALLLTDTGIIRHRGKIVSTINNARRTREIQDRYGSLAALVWRHEPDAATRRPTRITPEAVAAMPQTDASKALSKDLRKNGFSFVGPITCYAFMQAMGLVNDHVEDCHCRSEVETLRQGFIRPQ